MDKFSVISWVLFCLADLFGIASLAMPQWIVSDAGGRTNIGLIQTCLTISGRSPHCFVPDTLRGEWIVTFLCIAGGIVCVTITLTLLCVSYWKLRVIKMARWLGFVAMVLFCLAAVVFPIGFDTEQIGGEPYQLPSSYQVGLSYIFFVLALWLTVISELFAGKVCLPHF